MSLMALNFDADYLEIAPSSTVWLEEFGGAVINGCKSENQETLVSWVND